MHAQPSPAVWAGDPRRLGARYDGAGTNVAVWAPDASHVWVCIFDDDGTEHRIPLRDHTLGVWHGYLPDVGPGTQYGFRVDGPWDPARGRLFNPDKLLLDPYALAIDAKVRHDPVLRALTDAGTPVTGDTAAYVPRSVVVADDFDWGNDRHPDTPWAKLVIYEAHVKGLTRLMPDLPPEVRGTYAGLGDPITTAYLRDLGVTAVELLPVHHFVSEPALAERGLANYWGYNSIGYFAPHAAYSASGRRGGQVNEFKQMVKSLHAAGIEVILDVVYNHTAEGRLTGPDAGPTLCMRGFDDGAHYLHGADGRYLDVTGCGNTVNVNEPEVLRLVLDSLRYWVTEMHVDGFRFDLASALLRNGGEVDLRAPFLSAVQQDPVLRNVKLIAEPWDATPQGYLVGDFPPLWCEWNDKFRDGVRDFWRGQGDVRTLATRFAGSSDLYADDGRLPFSSINFVTAHDGFTMRDLVSYVHKHNEANGENNRDGTDDNRSDNLGVEGETDDAAINTARRRRVLNLMATLTLATGVPMITAGDERGRTQRGNNNPYCLDDETSWVDWDDPGEWAVVHDMTARLLRLRATHPVLRQRHFFDGRPADSGTKDVTWLHPSGREMTPGDWYEPGLATLGVLLSGQALRHTDARGRRRIDSTFLIWFSCTDDRHEVELPARISETFLQHLRTDTVEAQSPAVRRHDHVDEVPAGRMTLDGPSVVVLEIPGD